MKYNLGMKWVKCNLNNPDLYLEDFSHIKNVKAINPANIYLFKVNNRNVAKRCDVCSKLTIKTPARRQCCCTDVFIV